MKRLSCCIAAMLLACLSPASLCHAQDEGEQIAAGILGIIGESIRASNNQQQGWQRPGSNQGGYRAAPSYDPFSSGSTNLGPSWNQGNQNRWNSSRPSNSYRPQTYYNNPNYNNPNYNNPNYNNPNYTPGYSTPSYTRPGYSTPSYATPTYSTPTYSTPSRTTPSYPSPPLEPAVTYSGQPIVVRCPSSEYGIVSYVLSSDKGDYNYTMTPGQKQEFKENGAWAIKFDRGNGGGIREYRLRGGMSYKLVRDDDGFWQLYAERS